MTMATFSSWNSIKKAHHVDFVASRTWQISHSFDVIIGLDKGGVDPFSPKDRLSSIICDVASFRLFKPVRSEPLHDNNRIFLHIPFANKGIDAINISNILNRKEVVKEILPYFKNQSVPIEMGCIEKESGSSHKSEGS
jgi:hypothetical protein